MSFRFLISLSLLALPLAGCEDPAEAATPAPAPEVAPSAEAEPSAEAAPEAPSEPEEARALVAVGQPAPDFTLTDHAGAEHHLADYRGKIVVLEWTSPECPFVRRHYGNETDMVHTYRGLQGDDVVWLAVDSSHFNTAEASAAWREQHGIPYPILQDRDGAVGRLYAARTTPHMYVIDAGGVLRYQGAIDSDPRGREDAPTNYVSEAVGALQAGRPVPRAQTEPYGCTVKYGNS
ncbi:MAG: redoxin domain-containing protein [Myxococcota bacterium]